MELKWYHLIYLSRVIKDYIFLKNFKFATIEFSFRVLFSDQSTVKITQNTKSLEQADLRVKSLVGSNGLTQFDFMW